MCSLKQWRRFLSCRTWKGISQNPHTSERRLGKGDSHYHRASSSLRSLHITIDYIMTISIYIPAKDLVKISLSCATCRLPGSNLLGAQCHERLETLWESAIKRFWCLSCVWRDFPVAEGKIRTQRRNRLVRTQWWFLAEVRQKIGAVKL